jgi:hypothetical protein
MDGMSIRTDLVCKAERREFFLYFKQGNKSQLFGNPNGRPTTAVELRGLTDSKKLKLLYYMPGQALRAAGGRGSKNF